MVRRGIELFMTVVDDVGDRRNPKQDGCDRPGVGHLAVKTDHHNRNRGYSKQREHIREIKFQDSTRLLF